jgi:hypothetical protein
MLKIIVLDWQFEKDHDKKLSKHLTLKESKDRFNQFSSIFLLKTNGRWVKMFLPTVCREGEQTSKCVCQDVKIWEY